MAAPRRWIRVDVGWSRSEWLAVLEPAARLAWIELLTYAKTDGIAGTVRSLSPAVFGRMAGIGTGDVEAMLQAAESDGALIIGDREWTVTNWPEYQETDPGAAERMRRYRSEKSAHSPLRKVTRNNRNVTDRSGVTRRVTETETETEERDANASPSGEPDVRRVFDHWVKVTGRSSARTQLTPERRKKIKARLKRFSADDLCRAVDGVMLSEHHRSKAEWTDLISCFGNDTKVENHIARLTAHPNGNGRHDKVARTEDWEYRQPLPYEDEP